MVRPASALLAKFKYWDRYLEQYTYLGRCVWRGPLQGYKTERYTQQVKYFLEPPFTEEFSMKNLTQRNKRIFVEPINQWKIFKGDRVQVLAGRDKGKHGLVARVIPERNWVLVAGLNCKITSDDDPFGNTVVRRVAKPLLVSENAQLTQVALVDPEDNQRCEVKWKFTESGQRVRVSVRTGRIVPLPVDAKELADGVNPTLYADGAKDADEKVLLKRTFRPQLATFQQDIMQRMNIVETRTAQPNFWY